MLSVLVYNKGGYQEAAVFIDHEKYMYVKVGSWHYKLRRHGHTTKTGLNWSRLSNGKTPLFDNTGYATYDFE